jgi:hypothetical protein
MYEASIGRKARTEKFLSSVGVPLNPNLPRVEDDSEVRLRDALDVARRSIVLYCMSAVGFGAESNRAFSWLQNQNLWDFVSPDEKALLTNEDPSEQQVVEASWRVESLWTLLWSMGKIDSLEFPTDTCDVEKVQDIMPVPDSDCESFLADSTLRSLPEVLDQVDLIYRIHWAVREAQLTGQTMPCWINPSVVYERHYALNWLVGYADQWDDITTDT